VTARTAAKKSPTRAVTFAVARRLALALPGVTEGTSYGTPSFKVQGKFFFRIREDGGSLAVRIAFDTREALLQADPRAFFITDHYLGYPAICVRLANVRRSQLKSVLEEAWRFAAPKRLAAARLRGVTRKSPSLR
jgi:hypothetical protein